MFVDRNSPVSQGLVFGFREIVLVKRYQGPHKDCSEIPCYNFIYGVYPVLRKVLPKNTVNRSACIGYGIEVDF